ncbi:MAG TPA: asparagine synthase-related protein [Candidatus Acidoferrales bacterium]|nr:asparagine synthase-related protein [Candidatus Acidoferrales bacterium]
MSGFVGILNLDGAPVDRALLERMTRSLAFRGPDAEGIWFGDAVGLGHTLLRTERQSVPDADVDKQPAGLDGRLWIAVDGRIDARAELIEKLKSKSSAAGGISLSTPGAKLILHAYDAWGEACVEYLLGDFSFAIWDASRQRLFCARDHMGVKPFYYARIGSLVVFSNTLDCLRRHPAVSGKLNDLAIADFLIFDINQEPSTTSFADIHRLPPAHVLVCEQDKMRVRRYWELRVDTPIQFRRKEDYVARFCELLDVAVADRLRTERAGVLMSGGLDSTTVAASAQRNFMRNGRKSSLNAYTQVPDNLIPDEERKYATLTAEKLGIPIDVLVSDGLKIFEYADRPEYRTSEPTHTAWPDITSDHLRRVAAQNRVVLTGFGGDPALCGRITVHFRELVKLRQFGKTFRDAARYLGGEGRVSRLYISTRWRILFDSRKAGPSYPVWLKESLEKQLGLRERWRDVASAGSADSSSAVRPEAHETILDRCWPNLFESQDAGMTKIPVEVCHPIFDLRLLNFLLALPRLPWCCDKELFREAARGVLPDRVRLRRKSPLSEDPLVALLKRSESEWVDSFEPAPELERYVNRNRIPAVSREKNPWIAWVSLRPLSLDFWLRQVDQLG